MISSVFFEELFFESSKILRAKNSSDASFINREIKLEEDRLLDFFFRTALEKKTQWPVYSEESLGLLPDDDSPCWIVDPLDGSLNYHRQIPFYTSSICLWQNGKPTLGAIYDYSRSDLYFASPEEGARLNKNPIKKQMSPSLKQIKAVGIPSASSTDDSLDMFSKSLQDFKKLRWFGCASLSLAYVATGKVDSYEERGIQLWDVAAGLALVHEVGGRIQYSKNKNGTLNVIAKMDD